MFETLRTYFECRFALTDEQFDFIKKLFLPKHLKKGRVLLREGEVAKYTALLKRVVCAVM